MLRDLLRQILERLRNSSGIQATLFFIVVKLPVRKHCIAWFWNDV